MDKNEAYEFLAEEWGEEFLDVVMSVPHIYMTLDEFLDHCTACGGNWGGMFLTGIQELWPAVWDAIPDHMGVNAFTCIASALRLLGVTWPKDT